MDQNSEIKRANRRAMPKFILALVISMAVGGVTGYFAARYGLDALSGGMKAAGDWFGLRVAPWMMLALAIILPVIAVPLYQKAQKLLAAWDGEEEGVSDAVDGKLSMAIWITGAANIISFFLIAASYSGGFATFDDEKNTLPFFVSIGAFLVILVEALVIQQKCVDAAKKINPEKTASIYDMKFHKKWVDSCDEAEKLLIGKCAFKAYGAVNMACTILAPLLAVCALVFGIGFLPSLAVCIIWMVNQSAYCKEAIKYAKAGAKLSA